MSNVADICPHCNLPRSAEVDEVENKCTVSLSLHCVHTDKCKKEVLANYKTDDGKLINSKIYWVE